MIPGRTLAEEAHRAPVDHAGRVKRGGTLHLRAKPKLGIFVGARDAGLRLVEARKNFLGVVTDG